MRGGTSRLTRMWRSCKTDRRGRQKRPCSGLGKLLIAPSAKPKLFAVVFRLCFRLRSPRKGLPAFPRSRHASERFRCWRTPPEAGIRRASGT
jgi:hypothetical protein